MPTYNLQGFWWKFFNVKVPEGVIHDPRAINITLEMIKEGVVEPDRREYIRHFWAIGTERKSVPEISELFAWSHKTVGNQKRDAEKALQASIHVQTNVHVRRMKALIREYERECAILTAFGMLISLKDRFVRLVRSLQTKFSIAT
ncbi:MAG TPA: hypothetical protein VFM02_02550 [Candidatus Paceibacterota bacterium]|nr:hypothetical protein [Candidatus Paceibacterota bacterium]